MKRNYSSNNDDDDQNNNNNVSSVVENDGGGVSNANETTRPVRRRRIETTTATDAIDINGDKGISAKNISMEQLPSNNSGEQPSVESEDDVAGIIKEIEV